MTVQFSFEETPESRRETFDPPTYELIYKSLGETDDYQVSLYAKSAFPTSVYRAVGTLYRRNIQIDPDGWGQFVVTASYGALDSTGSTALGSSTFSFDTSGATIRVKAAREHVASYPTDGDWHQGAIGVKEDGDVEGVDIVFPALKLDYVFRHAAGIVSESFARLIASATGKTNAAVFRGFEIGELLFIGGSGSDGSQSEAEVSYSFLAAPNESNYTIGAIAGIVKQGHHVAWVEFEDDVQDGEGIRPPKRVNIERVYDSINFASVFGWS